MTKGVNEETGNNFESEGTLRVTRRKGYDPSCFIRSCRGREETKVSTEKLFSPYCFSCRRGCYGDVNNRA